MKYLSQSGGNRNKIDKIDKNFNLKIEFMKVDIFRIGRYLLPTLKDSTFLNYTLVPEAFTDVW